MSVQTLTIRELIEKLEQLPADTQFYDGFSNPHSWRGSYRELAVEPTNMVQVHKMINYLEEASSSVYEGWKGGAFKMNKECEVYLAHEGTCGMAILGIQNTKDGYSFILSEDY